MTHRLRMPWLVLCLLTCFLLMLSCSGSDRKQASSLSARELGYLLELEGRFQKNVIRQDGKIYRIDYLSGDSILEPRLTVHIKAREVSLEEHFEEQLDSWMDMELVEEGESSGIEGINAVGMQRKLILRPFPEKIPDLELLVDLHVFIRGDEMFSFTWQQDPDDDKTLSSYYKALALLQFVDREAAN